MLASSTFRLTVAYVALVGASVLLLLGFIYWSTAAYMARQADATIEAEITGLAERYERDGLSGLTRTIAERLERQRPTGLSLYLLVDRRRERRLGNLDRWPQVQPDEDGWIDFILGDPAEGDTHKARARTFRLQGGFALLVGRDVNELAEIRQLLVRTLATGFGITMLLALAGGLVMSRRFLRRIETINQASREIMSGDLTRRIPTRRTGDDFDELAGNLNAMLARIESLMESVRRVSDNIAHDLRTPLARLRHELESARLGSGGERAETLERAIAEADGLLATFNALLRIARIESEDRRASFTSLSLRTLVEDVVELYEPLAEERDQTLVRAAEGDFVIEGDRDLLFQALANLVDNAIKYTPAGGRIHVGAIEERGCPTLVVSDDGPGIPAAFADKVFQRFFRMETSRSTAGNGLGLSLVAAVARHHGIEVRLEDNRPGLRVGLRFPAASTTRPALDSRPS